VSSCCACGSAAEEVLDLGLNYLSDFVNPGEPRGDRWPLRLVLCQSCSLLQLGEVTPRPLVHHERYAFRSGINESIRADLRAITGYALGHAGTDRGRWLDTGSNDGTLLSMVPAGWHRTGVDPLKQFADDCAQHADRVITEYFTPERFDPGEFGVVTSSAMFYDLADPGGFARDVAKVLAPGGVWVIQQNYALDMLRNNVVDNIVHEHVTYFSVASLAALMERCGLEITDVAYSGAKGGCIRTAVSHRGARPVSASVAAALRREQPYRLADPVTWTRWGQRTRLELAETLAEITAARDRGWRTLLYGASTRGATFLQMIGAGPDLLPACADRDTAKIGKVMTATGIPIISEEEMRASPPEYLLCGPWFFRDLFLERETGYLEGGGRWIFPLPRFEVVSG
jgi:hypothetical protein